MLVYVYKLYISNGIEKEKRRKAKGFIIILKDGERD